jgi:VCBS repeat-containing protein
MINKFKKIKITIFIILIALIFNLTNNIYAASVSLSSTSSLEIGATTTLTITGSDAIGKFSISSSNPGVVSTSTNSIWVEGSASVTLKANSAGSATISVNAVDVSDASGNAITPSGSKTITVNAPVVQQPTVTQPSNNNTAPAATNKNTNNTTTNTNNSNANLKKLVPNKEGLSPNFNSNITKYSLAVPSTLNDLGLTVATEATGAKYYITGDKNLQMGDNIVSITVTAVDGTKKTYTIVVTKADDATKANAYLNNIVVDGYELSPTFTSENLEYDIDKVNLDKLTVLAYAQNEKSKIEIIGNEGLVDGENTIKIKVTAEDGTTTKEYTIKVVKEAAPVVTEENEEMNSLKDVESLDKKMSFLDIIKYYIQNYWIVIYLLIFSLFELFQIIYLYKKANKNNNINKKDNEKIIIKANSINDVKNENDNKEKKDNNNFFKRKRREGQK